MTVARIHRERMKTTTVLSSALGVTLSQYYFVGIFRSYNLLSLVSDVD